MADQKRRGQIKQAPENFISQDLIADLNQNGMDDTRRGFMRSGFMAAIGGAVGLGSSLNVLAAGEGDPAGADAEHLIQQEEGNTLQDSAGQAAQVGGVDKGA